MKTIITMLLLCMGATAQTSGRGCVKVFLNIETIITDDEPGGKLFIAHLEDELTRGHTSSTPGSVCLTYGGRVHDANDWESHAASNDGLIEVSTGTIDDDSIGNVGKHIEAVTYVIHTWENKRKRIIGLGPALITFAVGDLKSTDDLAPQRAVMLGNMASVMMLDSRNQALPGEK